MKISTWTGQGWRASLAVAIIVLAGALGQPAAHSAPAATNPAARKILFLGNSITRHGPKADIGWTGNWGMAASALEKDYVHVLASAMARRAGLAPETLVENIADFERKPEAFDYPVRLAKARAFRPDIIILAIAENVPALKTDAAKAAFADHVKKLLAALKELAAPGGAIYVRSSFWPDAAKDGILQKAAAEAGATFVDISAVGKDPANRAKSERPTITHEGVGAHPGDQGMEAIADALLKAILERESAGKKGK